RVADRAAALPASGERAPRIAGAEAEGHDEVAPPGERAEIAPAPHRMDGVHLRHELEDLDRPRVGPALARRGGCDLDARAREALGEEPERRLRRHGVADLLERDGEDRFRSEE